MSASRDADFQSERRLTVVCGHSLFRHPREGGIQTLRRLAHPWVPAFAGMTKEKIRQNSSKPDWYLFQSLDKERDANELVALIIGSNSAESTPENVRNLVDRRVRDDFAAGHTVRIHGWVLSRTEARLAALVTLG